MNNEMIIKLGKRIAIKMAVVNIAIRKRNENNSIGECNKFDFELSGMLQALKSMEIPFAINCADDGIYKSIIIDGNELNVR